MNYITKTITIQEEDVRLWINTFEKRNPVIITIVPGLCIWSYAHQEVENWVAANIEIKFYKPICVGETIVITGKTIKKRNSYCKRILTISVNDEIRQQAELKCMTLCKITKE